MKTVWNFSQRSISLLFAATVAFSGAAFFAATPVRAQELLQEQGSLRPSQDEYTFTGEAGQTIAVVMTSDEFDTVVSLVNEAGEEVAFNDDFGGSLNSTMIYTLPTSGTYTVIARSFSGNGGNYVITVREATAYESAYGRAYNLYLTGNYDAAMEAYNEVIQIDPDQPQPYLDRAAIRWDQLYSNPNFGPEGPELSDEVRDAIIADYNQAADLYEAQGNSDLAESLRAQVEYLLTE